MSGAPDPRVGTVLRGKWRLERVLGSGGMGAVYVARHTIGRREAIKILHREVAHDPLIRQRFRQEAEAVNRLRHPGVVEIRDIDETEDGCPFMVMELLDGQSLSDRIAQRGYPSLDEVLRIAAELLDVLVVAHGERIIHRDIKPANLFLLNDGRLKVLDFGVAQVQRREQLTRAGTMLGTVAYMPPEQVLGKPIDRRADLFAVGATMFRLIAQRRIHDAEMDSELIVKMGTLPAPPLGEVAPGTPEGVCRVVDRALRFTVDERYPDAATMRDDLRAVIAGQPPPFASNPVASRPVAAVPSIHDALTSIAPIPGPAMQDATQAAAGTSLNEASSVLTRATAWTQWTQLTPRERRTRWTLLALPLVGLAVVVLVFQLMVHAEEDDGTAQAARKTDGPTREPQLLGRAPALEEQAPSRQDIEAVAIEPEPAAGRNTESCIRADRCDRVCTRKKCKHACERGDVCEIGLADGAKVDCKGKGLCEVWCEGECEVKCKNASCRVHCAPGDECEIEECRGRRQRCENGVLTCNAACE